MIEFIIPLNLPVRAVEITETTAAPSESLQQEMSRWATHRGRHLTGSDRPTGIPSAEIHAGYPETSNRSADELNKERESLRTERALFATATQELRHVTKQLEKQLDGMILEFQEATIEIATAIASKLVFEEVVQNRFPIANLVHEVVSRLDSHSNTIVRLHPDDLALIADLPPIEHESQDHTVRYVADSTLARGDCKAKSGDISVIYELRRQADDIRRQLLSTVSGHAET